MLSIILSIYIFLFAIYIMKNNIRLKIRDFARRGGRRVTEFQATPPQVSATSPTDQLNRNMENQKAGDLELADMNKKLAGGGVVAPQMQQAGAAGNEAIAGGIASGLQANADGVGDTAVMNPNDVGNTKSTVGVGGRRRKRKTKRRRKKKKRKTKRKRKSRRKSRRKRRKSKRKRRR